MKSYLLYLYAESPIHAGAADPEGSINLPIQRETPSGLPVIWGQSLKGALRQAAYESTLFDMADGTGDRSVSTIDEMFGSGVGEGQNPALGQSAGLLTVGDAQLVAMPVPTLQDTFAWVTSTMILGRLHRKYSRAGIDISPKPLDGAHDGALSASTEWAHPNQVLGPAVVPVTHSTDVRCWAGIIANHGIGEAPHLAESHERMKRNLIVVDRHVMRQLSRECTEHSVRVQLGQDTKTVANGPFTSEYLPTETLLVSLLTLREPMRGDKPRLKNNHEMHGELLTSLLNSAVLQIGGDETLGKGIVWTKLVEAQA